MHKLIKNKFADFIFNSSLSSVEIHWKGYIPSDEFRKILKEALEHYKKLSLHHPNLGWLANALHLGIISEEDQEWVEKYYNPFLYQAGLKYMAVVMPDNVFGQISIKEIVSNNLKHDKSALSYQKELFNNIELARHWLSNILEAVEE